MTTRAGRRTATVLLTLALAAGCGGDDEATSATASPSPSTVATADPSPTPAQCPEGDVEQAVCRFIPAVQAGDLTSLSQGERAVAAEVEGELPPGAWEIDRCDLIGDVTVLCVLRFDASAVDLGFHVAPVNAEYVDGELITADGEAVRYEVVEYLGTDAEQTFP